MSDFNEILERQQKLYSESLEKVRGESFTEESAIAYYSRYVNYVCETSGRRDGSLLDVGCGNGWSSYCFAKKGFRATGVDLNPDRFEAPATEGLSLQKGSMLDMEFEVASFDVVVSYQTLEHVPDTERGLAEMLRVLKPGGTIVIVSPNLLSMLSSLRGLTKHAWRNRPARRIFLRDAEMPRHPEGNTVLECFLTLLKNPIMLVSKMISKNVRFTMREPDLNPPFHGDNDACYLCNPIDLLKFFKRNGCEIVRVGLPGRPPLSWLIASGTYVTARKR